MSKQIVKAYLYMDEDYTGKWKPVIKAYLMDDRTDCVSIGEIEVEVEAPDNFDPTAKQVAALQRQRATVVAKYTAELGAIDGRIAKLQAINYEPAEVTA